MIYEKNLFIVCTIFLIKTGIGSGMANRSGGTGFDQEGILITICHYFPEMQVITAFLALGPEPLLGAAEESDLLGRKGLLQGGGVHVAEAARIVEAQRPAFPIESDRLINGLLDLLIHKGESK